jgi:L-alanine-DL-glutamate epimerase-like enolase superfamily enzyme
MPKIQQILLEKVDLKLTRPYTIAFKTVDHVENAIVKIILDNGIVGYGAGNPSEQVVGENLNQSMSALEKAVFGSDQLGWPGLVGKDIEALDQLCKEIQHHLPNSPSARTALEVGLYDCLAQCQGKPLAVFLGQQHHSMPTSITIGIKGVRETLDEASEYYHRGFRYLKVKLGNNLQEDVERVIKIREQFAEEVKIRVDANQGYTVDELQRFYHETINADLELIEQPLPVGQEEQMRSLPPEVRRLLAADESLISPSDGVRLIAEKPACGIFNIKLMKCGGLTQALKISSLAENADIDLMWGCNDESIISITAALHLAFACKNTKYLDLDGSLDLAEDVVSGGFVLEKGWMSINNLPGLGLIEN